MYDQSKILWRYRVTHTKNTEVIPALFPDAWHHEVTEENTKFNIYIWVDY